jgi:hypothetical protein
MGEGLTVDPVDLHVVGATLTTAAQDAGTEFDQHHDNLVSSSYSLFSATRVAITGKVDDWRSVATAHTATVQDHGRRLHGHAITYVTIDTHNGETLPVVEQA